MPRAFAAQLPRNYPHRGGNCERGKKALSCGGEGNLGGILRDNLGEGNCESKIAETVGSLFLPRGIKMPRRALWQWMASPRGTQGPVRATEGPVRGL